MINIAPFKAVRPTRDKVHLVATKPYYTYDKDVLLGKLKGNPFTFLRIISPDFGQKESPIPNSQERFAHVRDHYEKFKQDGIFIQDDHPCFYVYKQTSGNKSYTGLIAGISANDYEENRIKKHEATLTHREEMFTNYLDTVEFNAEPVLMSFEGTGEFKSRVQRIGESRPEYEYSSTDRKKHELWIIDLEEDIDFFIDFFKSREAVYIADGHHRSASSCKLAKRRGDTPGTHSHFLTYLLPEDELDIVDFNRLILDTDEQTKEDIFAGIEKNFHLEKTTNLYVPERLHNFSMYMEGEWYKLTAKEHTVNSEDVIQSLDSFILSEYLLKEVFGIADLKIDRRIDFISGIEGPQGMKEKVDSGKAFLAFGLHPVSLDQLKAVADNNEVMPPKSTWIEPKLRSGLTIYPIEK